MFGKKKEEEIIVLSVGGSLIFPEEIDINFLKGFRELILKYLKKGKRFIIITGGGKICRKYQNAASTVVKLEKDDLDWLGIHATRINAHLVRTIFRKESHSKIIKNPTEKIDFKEKILVAAGWKPGCSTDYDAVLIAKNFNVKEIINLTNINCVCDKDPNKFKDAKPITKSSWDDFRKLLPEKWDPGLNSPFDPIAAKEAQESGLKVIILNGNNLNNFDNCLDGKEFVGTIIE